MKLELHELVIEPEGRPWRKVVYRGEHWGKNKVLEFFITVRVFPQYSDPEVRFQIERVDFGDDCCASSMAEVLAKFASRLSRGAEVVNALTVPSMVLPMMFDLPEGEENSDAND